jgi:hypothetical protein
MYCKHKNVLSAAPDLVHADPNSVFAQLILGKTISAADG